ncbi:protein kinase domain-containing protein [Rhodococcus koreensis]
MANGDPFRTRRNVATAIAGELSAAGFEDAVEIGRGGFGVVYRCSQSALQRTVAVKVLTAELDEENRERFLREQRAMGKLTGHPNIAGVLQVGATENGHPFLVMPYYPQGSLDTRIRRHGPLSGEEVLRLGVKVAGGLETAHRLSIVHRDVKPANILITDYGEPVLTDFGIAHVAGGFTTATSRITGSPAYTSPEVLGGDPSTPAADVYGLGATLFTALTGHAAFERRSGEQVVAQFLRITTEPAPDLREHGVAADISAVIEHAMTRNPSDRPAVVALGEQLQQLQVRRGYPSDEMALLANLGPEQEKVGPVPLVTVGSALRRPPAFVGASGGVKGNLPVELTSFVGRRREATEAKRLLSDSRLVTLTGIGGVGKTRLALRVADSVRRAFGDGVWLIELGELQDSALLVDTVAAALGLRKQSVQSPQELLANYLADRRLLLVLDNCEHLVGAVAGLAEALLHGCPELRILATSREPLGIGGETVLRVPPLAVPDPDRTPSLQVLPRYEAVTLFVERARAAVPTFSLTESNLNAVARICQRLEGLPLPIELAAARMRALSAEQVLQRLTDRYRLLTAGRRDAPSRQQTLRLCVDWSYELCTPQEQRMWSWLSVFSGGFELEAAEEICASELSPNDLLDVVASLVDKSVLIREQAGDVARYRLLETLRDYGREKLLASGTYPRLRRRHQNWYERLALRAEEEWIGPRQVDWIARLAREQSNLREVMEFCLTEPGGEESALRIATAMYPFWLSRGLLGEGRHWLGRAVAIPCRRATLARVEAICAASMLAVIQDDIALATSLIEEGRQAARVVGDAMSEAVVDQAAGQLATFSGDLTGALELFERALVALRAEGDLLRQVTVLLVLAIANWLLGDADRAAACHEEVLAITEAHGESVYRAYSLGALGMTLWQRDPDRAARLLEQGLRLSRVVDDTLGSAHCIEAMAWIAAARRDLERAAELMGVAHTLWQSVGNQEVVIRGLRAFHEECEKITRRALGEQAFTTAFRRGADLNFEHAVGYALGEAPSAEKPVAETATLTRRERQVADLVAQGLTNRAIAEKLVISPRTAQGHVEHLLIKLGFTSRAQIAAWVVEQSQEKGV